MVRNQTIRRVHLGQLAYLITGCHNFRLDAIVISKAIRAEVGYCVDVG